MKINSKLFVAPLMGIVVCGSLTLTSCDKESKDENEPINTDVPENPEPGNMTANEQKEKLDNVGLALADQLKASELKYLSNLNSFVDETLCDYEGSAVTDWFSNLIDQMTTGGTLVNDTVYDSTSEDYYAQTYYINHYLDIDHTTKYTQLIVLSNFTGHFSADAGKWSYTKADDLQFDFKDQEGKSCTLKVETSGNYKDVYYGSNSSWVDSDYKHNATSYEKDGSKYEESFNQYEMYIDLYEQTVRVPENIEVTLTQERTNKARLKLATDLSKMSQPDFDLSKDAFSAKGLMQIADYAIICDRVAYDANKDASIYYSIVKDAKTLFSFLAEATGNVQQETLESVKVVINFMDEVQIKGTVNDGSSFIKYCNLANENDRNEKKYKSYISLANDLLNLGVYYNNKDVRQAKIVLECFPMDDYWGSDDAWDCEPVFYFGDATTYSTFGAFFSEGFDKLVAKFEKILDDLNDL